MHVFNGLLRHASFSSRAEKKRPNFRPAFRILNTQQRCRMEGQVGLEVSPVGRVVQGYVSPDGVAWTLVGSETIALPTAVYLGLPVTDLRPS